MPYMRSGVYRRLTELVRYQYRYHSTKPGGIPFEDGELPPLETMIYELHEYGNSPCFCPNCVPDKLEYDRYWSLPEGEIT